MWKDLPSLLLTEFDGLGDESLVVGELGSGEARCQCMAMHSEWCATYMREGLVVASWGL